MIKIIQEVIILNYIDGKTYWKSKTQIKNTYPYLTYDTYCDVLIIGGGITGAITAYFLAKEGVNVIIAEKNIGVFICWCF